MQEKYIQKLMNCSSINEFVSMFFGLGLKEQLSVMGDRITIPRDTILYRARKDEGTPLNLKSDWLMAPKDLVKKGRFNYDKKPVLYLSTMDFVLPREIGLKPNEGYYLAKYRCTNDISVGSFLKTSSPVTNLLHIIAMSIESDDKLTPSEIEELSLLNKQSNQVESLSGSQLSQLYIHKFLNKSLYDITNKLCDLVLNNNPNGIRYCSCYVPIELSGSNQIVTLDGELEGNYALTEKGIENIEYLESEYKIYSEEDYSNDLSLYIKTFRELN